MFWVFLTRRRDGRPYPATPGIGACHSDREPLDELRDVWGSPAGLVAMAEAIAFCSILLVNQLGESDRHIEAKMAGV